MRPGYYRDADSWLYLTPAGRAYYVAGPDAGPEPAWREIDPSEPGDDGTILSGDAEPATPHAEDLAAFEAVRRSYGIPA